MGAAQEGASVTFVGVASAISSATAKLGVIEGGDNEEVPELQEQLKLNVFRDILTYCISSVS